MSYDHTPTSFHGKGPRPSHLGDFFLDSSLECFRTLLPKSSRFFFVSTLTGIFPFLVFTELLRSARCCSKPPSPLPDPFFTFPDSAPLTPPHFFPLHPPLSFECELRPLDTSATTTPVPYPASSPGPSKLSLLAKDPFGRQPQLLSTPPTCRHGRCGGPTSIDRLRGRVLPRSSRFLDLFVPAVLLALLRIRGLAVFYF